MRHTLRCGCIITYESCRDQLSWEAQPERVGDNVNPELHPARSVSIPNGINFQDTVIHSKELKDINDSRRKVGNQTDENRVIGQDT